MSLVKDYNKNQSYSNIEQKNMDIQDSFDKRKNGKKLRIKINTNRNIKFITTVKLDATISDLANRALSVYLELTGEGFMNTSAKKQLTVSAVKQGIFYMPKSESVVNLLNPDDEVEVVIIKAKPKYPNQIFHNNQVFNKIISAQKQSLIQGQQRLNKEILPLEPSKIQAEQIQLIDNEVQKELQIQHSQTLSKRQRKRDKRDKKKKKIGIKNKISQSLENRQRKKQEADLKQAKDKQFYLQSLPKKKIKLQKQDLIMSPDKVMPMIIPSPKITFHSQPKIQSPKISFMSDSIKKRPTFDGQVRKPSDDVQKRINFQKLVPPAFSSKSPVFLHRTPTPTQSNLKQKQQLLNFSLVGRKFSEDKKVDQKRQKQKLIEHLTFNKMDQSPNKSNWKQQKIAEKISVKQKQPFKPMVQQKVEIKETKQLLIVEQEDSESEQNKKEPEFLYPNHRQKELAQIQHKINSFLIESDDQN